MLVLSDVLSTEFSIRTGSPRRRFPPLEPQRDDLLPPASIEPVRTRRNSKAAIVFSEQWQLAKPAISAIGRRRAVAGSLVPKSHLKSL